MKFLLSIGGKGDVPPIFNHLFLHFCSFPSSLLSFLLPHPVRGEQVAYFLCLIHLKRWQAKRFNGKKRQITFTFLTARVENLHCKQRAWGVLLCAFNPPVCPQGWEGTDDPLQESVCCLYCWDAWLGAVCWRVRWEGLLGAPKQRGCCVTEELRTTLAERETCWCWVCCCEILFLLERHGEVILSSVYRCWM